MMGMKWGEQHDQMLVDCIKAGASYREVASEINTRFGTSFSRNAAIGRGKRLGLCIGRAERLEKLRTCMARARAALRKPAQRKVRPMLKAFKCDDITGLRSAEVEPLHLLLIDLEPAQCRWPYGDGPFTFCGCPIFGDTAYCEPHLSLSLGAGTNGELAAHRVSRRIAA